MMGKILVAVIAFVGIAGPCFAGGAVTYEKDIKGIVAARCNDCHGAQAPAMEEWKRTMDGCISSGNPKAYNEMVPHYNRMNGERNEMVTRLERKQREHAALVGKYNRDAERYNSRGRLQP